MKIQLKKLKLINFKGIRSLSVDFEDVTNIFGENATGKSTLLDSFLWLLFGKDSSDRKDFEIKTLDENNQPYHRLDHEVEGAFDNDGSDLVLRKVFREKWTKKRGSTEAEFTGHETAYYWNDVPLKQEEYQAKIAEIINENLFKLLTNTNYFNSMKWQDRRAVLMQMAGKIDDVDVLNNIEAGNDEKFKPLVKALQDKKSIEEFKKEIAAKKKKLKDNLDFLPARIEEANRALPEEKDYSQIDELIASVTADIEEMDGLLQNRSAAFKKHTDHITDLLRKKQNLERQVLDIGHNITNQLTEKKRDRESKIHNEKSELQRKNNELQQTRKDYSIADARKKQLIEEQTGLRDKWQKVNDEKLEFKEGEFSCPACKREYEASDIEAKKQELLRNFNSDKARRLKEITDRGTALANEISDIETKMGNLKAKGEKLNEEISLITTRISDLEEENNRLTSDESGELQKAVANHNQYQQCKAEIEQLQKDIAAPFEQEDNSALQQRKKELQSQLDQLKTETASKGQREKQLARITELQEQEQAMAQELASLEGTEFAIQQFEKAQMNELEKRVNGKFKIAQFKLFETQINGGEIPCCTTLINGVPYPDANSAAKIQCGIDIINALSDHYGIQAPVWVDNRETVIKLPDTNCQLINLIVSEKDKKLRIETSTKEMEAVA